ncbi:hypothetical protein VPH35_013703 [Triticum aestivum]
MIGFRVVRDSPTSTNPQPTLPSPPSSISGYLPATDESQPSHPPPPPPKPKPPRVHHLPSVVIPSSLGVSASRPRSWKPRRSWVRHPACLCSLKYGDTDFREAH